MSEEAITCRGLRKVFRNAVEELVILRGVDMSLERGDCSSITGPSGCGKSTLLSILGGLDKPSSGEVSVGGVNLAGVDETSLAAFRSRVVGFVFQFHYLLKDFTALENVMLPSFMLKGDRKTSEAKARQLLHAVGLSDRIQHVPSRLSGGERQRVAIARALINDPVIILADEPTGNLDRASALLVEDLLFGIAADRGTTLLIVTHDPGLASRAHRRFTLLDGMLTTT